MKALVPWVMMASVSIAVASAACGGLRTPCRYGDTNGCSDACLRGNDAGSCTRLGAMYETGNVEGDADQALRHYLRACLLGDGLGCHMAGLKYLLGIGVEKGNLTPRPRDRALQLAGRSFEAACTLKYGDGCAMMGAIVASMDPPHVEQAVELYEQGCALGGALGCRLRGQARLDGVLPRDTASARKFFDLACDAGDHDACALAKSVSAIPSASATSSASAPPTASAAPPSASVAPSTSVAPSVSAAPSASATPTRP